MNRFYSNYRVSNREVFSHAPAMALRKLLYVLLIMTFAGGSNAYAAEDFIHYQYYEGTWTNLPDFDTLTPLAEGTQETFALTGARDDYFAFRYTAKLFVAEAGTYTFYTTSDDGSALYVDGAMVVNNDGLHGPTMVSAATILDVGYHEIEVSVFEELGGASLVVEWEGPSQVRTQLQSFLSPDLDNDGIDNAVEGVDDTDSDGTEDYLDTDSDGDGINDSVENASAPASSTSFEYESTTPAITRNPANVSSPWNSGAAGLAATEGSELAHFNVNYQSNLYYDLGVLAAGTYTVNLDVGDFNNYPYPPNITSGVFTGGTSATDLGTLLTSQRITNVQPAPGTWSTWSYEFEVPAGDPLIGQSYGLNFDVGTGSATENVGTDNVVVKFVGLLDTDSDGIPNYLDVDSDGDSVFDSMEGIVDSDNDGTPDYLDTDDNGDGVPTMAQAGIGNGTEAYPFTSLSAALNSPAGVYWFETAAGTFQGNVDDAEGGGWITILNYLHLDGTNPDVAALTDRLPLIASSTLGTDESASATAWGHTSNALLSSLDPVETRWYAETSAHSRVIHFSTPFGIDYLTTGTGDMVGVNADFTALTGHTAFIPASAAGTVGNSGDFSLTNFPFYQAGARHWGIRGSGSRWEVDDYAGGSTYDTYHRVWARGDQLTAADLADNDSDSTPDYREITDPDGDGVPDGLDIDDDNDGILDVNEGALITPTGGAISGSWAGRDHTRSINDAAIISISDSIGAVTADNQTIFETTATTGWIEFNLPSDSKVSGVALWAPGVPFGGEDAPMREFTVTVTYNNGLSWTSHSLVTEIPTALGYPDKAQVFELGQTFENVTALRLNIKSAWINQGANHTDYASSDDVAVPSGYNMTLGEFRAIVDADGDLISNKNDLDSDNDGISDLYESGAPSSWIAVDTNSDGTVSIAEAEVVLGVGNADTDNDGLLDIFGRFIMDENSGWVTTDAARASNTGRNKTANNGTEPTAGLSYIHFDSLNDSWAHSEYRDLGAVFQPGIYTFTIDVSNVGDFGWPANAFVQITSGVSGAEAGTVVSSTSSTTPEPASAATETWTITVEIPNNSPLIGQAIGFEVGVGAPDATNATAGFDNLKISVTPLDTDEDALADYLDLDSDQDGIPDTIEARSSDAYDDHANDGSDNVDSDGDGVLNLFDSASTFGGTHINFVAPVNTDTTDKVDYLDTDSDNDGLLDSVESGLAAVTDATYADPDGTLGTPRDSGNTAEKDFRELDSDGDGIDDSIEGNADADNDSIPNYLDTDSDGDGIDDSVEGNVDTDNDSTPDYLDTDSDNDGTDDVAEGTGDEDGDGIPDYQDNFFDVIQDAVVWFRADEGISDSGAGVSSWADQSSSGTDVTRTPSAAVSVNDGLPQFNFNPSVVFDGSDGSFLAGTAASGSPDDETFIAVTRYTGNGSIEGVVSYGSKGLYVSGSASSHQYVLDGNGAGPNSSSNSDYLTDVGASLISGFYRADTTTNSAFYTNGGLAENYLGGGNASTGTSAGFEIGGRTLGGLNQRVFQGEIAEVIQISSDISGFPQQSIIESYLASKYGISLDQNIPTDYVDSAGAVVWSAGANLGYTDDIFGLSRDDLYNLDQRVSKSVSAGAILTIALEADFISPNQDVARTTAHTNDKQFLYLSNNGEGTGSITNEVPPNEPLLGNIRIAREWRVTKSANYSHSTHLSFSGFDNSYYLVSDSDGDFSSGANVLGRLSATGEFPSVLFSDGQFLSLVRGLDTDSDGTIDLIDSDDDNDGIPDSVEGSIDSDNDGIPNSLDSDSDGDGVPDTTEGADDTDSDGTPDYLDEDSDGDGVPDATEGADTNILVDSSNLSGTEDSAVALGIVVDSSLLSGGPWPPIAFSASANNGTLSHGAVDPDTGAWVVAPTDIASLSFIPDSHYSGTGTVFTINYNGENDSVSIDVTRVADAPTVNGFDQQGTQRVVADASDSYSVTLVDLDGSESLSVELTITATHTISDGVNSFTATAGNTTVDVTNWNPSTFTYLSDDVGVIPVGIRAVATDTDGFSGTTDTAETNSSFNITILLDTDGDGDADIIDTDDDNDGISDVDEGTADSDGDGTPDSLDTDSDGDGVPDGTEGGGDADGDGILDHIDNDTDGDGILDVAEGTIDSDGDTIPDYLDTDSDGDGLGDAAEGAIDSDNDGIPNYLDIDSDGDGINDVIEGSIDTDSDGTLDYLDQDSDGDGISDSVEGAIDSDEDGAADYVDLDSDGDGITDTVEGVADTDSDGQADYLDTDSDGDGIADVDEGTADSDGDGIPNSQDTDANNDGIPDADLGTGDLDGDGIPDYLDDDIDGDGIANASEGAPNPTDDSDGDGIPNYADSDSDNDGIDDAAEGNGDLDGDGIPDYLDGDSDGDGIADINEGSLDSDNDGIPDYADTDSDGDGVPDAAEGSADTDLDGVPDYLDLDVDGDGIPDVDEGFIDSDGDGTPDYKDLDSDNDGHGDGAEGTVDSDGDGILDYLDPDSDNDGLLDSEEASGDTDGDGIADYLDDDSDNDGIPDGVEGTLDSDGDGAVDYLDDDSDGDGIPDNLEGSGDADGDLIPDYLDSDSDNDGIPDSIEGSGDYDNDGIPDSIDTDANGDGIPDAALGSGDQDGDGVPDYLDGDIDGDGIANGTEGSVVPAEDSDGDGIPNYADTDSDNDGIPDFLEGTGDADGDGTPDAHDTDSDNDGLADSAEGILDSDGDGIPDNLDTDSDGDGIDDSIETSADTDGDGIPNYLDTDGDNDGISDALEGSGDADGDGAPDFLDNDSDGDGITDGAEGSSDTDGDGIPDYLDSDSDGDGIPDVTEGSADSDGDGIPDSQDTDANGDGIPDANLSDGDIDGDGIPDYLDGDIDGDGIPNGSEGALNPAADSDGDGIPNYADSDSDNDGVPDSVEGTGDADGDGLLDAFDPDADNDGIPDGEEGTNDTDGDGILDYLDSDSDNDGIPDSVEGSGDSDGDGIPDSQDSDGNNDGIPDSLLGSGDLDSDGIPDYLDSDIDGDGVSNIDEAQPDATTDSDGDGFPDFIDSDSDNDGVPDSEESRGDTDGDGIPDFADTDADGDGVPDVAEGFGDTDGDGVADFLDLDADNDGIPDVTEGAKDTDGDGVLDVKDLDSDNDGLPDIIEAGGDDADGNGLVDNYVDNNADGYDDGMAAFPLPVDNSDSDGLPDYKDLDSDNDGIPDTRESALANLDRNGDGRIDDGVDAQAPQSSSDFPGSLLLNDILDENGDGWADNIPANMIVDTDGDGTPNHQDLDSDGDGINDLIEAGGVDEDGDGQVDGWNDADADGIPDDIDADQLGVSDSDGDGIADFADADTLGEADADGDGIVDRFDIDPFDEGFARSSSGEPLLSSALPDTDGDGISDVQQPINEQGFIRTGLGGGGSINPLSLMALWLFGAVVLRYRRALVSESLLNTAWRKTMHSISQRLILVCALVFTVSGCSSFGYQQQNDEPVLAGAIPEQLKIGRHLYVAAGVGMSRLNPDTSEVTTFAVNDRSNAGRQITLGVDVSRQLSLELHSADLGAAGLSPEGGINYNMHGASALVYAGKNRHNYKRAGFTGYGRVGYGVMANSAAANIPFRQEESNHLLIGAGLEYMTSVGLGLRAELVSYEDDAQYGQLALIYRTGSPRRGQNGGIADLNDEPALGSTSEPLLQAAIAVSQEINACASSTTDDNVYFDTNSVVMSTEGRRLLRAVGQRLISCENLKLAVSAHTDEVGAPSYNKKLSQRRASVVTQHLLSMGIQPSRIESNSYGETRPVAPNSSSEGRMLNRRVRMEVQ